MNKKLSIIMLLSCVGNVISSEAAKTNKEKLKELPGVIYCSTVDAAKKVGSAINTKPGVALVSSACTLSGYQVYQLPKVQNAISVAKEAASDLTEAGSLIACNAGSATCTLFKNVGSSLSNAGIAVLNKGSSISREAVDFIAQHKVGACVAGVAALGGLGYGLLKYKEGTAAAAASRRQLEKDEQAKVLSDFLAKFGGDVNSDNGMRTPLIAAVELNNLPLVESLIKEGAKVNLQISKVESGHKGRDALFFAANWGRPEIVKALLAAGADNFGDALKAAEINKDKGYAKAGTVVEYEAVIKAIKAKEAASSASVAGGAAARSN